MFRCAKTLGYKMHPQVFIEEGYFLVKNGAPYK